MAAIPYCDGIKRRNFLKVGVLGTAGLTLANYFNLASAGEVSNAKAKSAIFIELGGGPSHMDTFDLKPDAASDSRGEFKPIKTNVSGIEICEHLPNLAKCADKYALVRSVSHTLAAHELGREYINTGTRPIPSLTYPAYGSVVSKERPSTSELPSFVAIPASTVGAGFLGVQYSALETNAVPVAGKPFSVRGIGLGKGVRVADLQRRERLLDDLDNELDNIERSTNLLEGLDRFSQQAFEIISSPKARQAFDISKEDPKIAARFGTSDWGQSYLLAARLIEAGVRFVTVTSGSWDTHFDNFRLLKNNLMPKLDVGLSGLLTTLADKGLLESTAVYVVGEFGRTPKINSNRGGRDHWPRAMTALLAGGGVRGGQVIGATDKTGSEPATDPITPDQLAASFYSSLGIDYHREYRTPSGRPVMLVRDGSVIPGLYS